MGETIQFKGIDDTVAAYRMHDTPAWSIWCGKAFMHRGLDEAELRSYLDLMSRSETVAIYTLKVYDDIDDVKQIKERTEAAGSFKFVLVPELRTTGRTAEMQRMEDRIKELEAQLDDKEEEDEGILGKIGNAAIGWLQDPDKLISIINGVKSILQSPQGPQMIGNVIRGFAEAGPATAVNPVNTIPSPPNENFAMPQNKNNEVPAQISAEQRMQRLAAALDLLEKHDPKVLEHLEKLAVISAEEPKTFKMLITTLENF